MEVLETLVQQLLKQNEYLKQELSDRGSRASGETAGSGRVGPVYIELYKGLRVGTRKVEEVEIPGNLVVELVKVEVLLVLLRVVASEPFSLRGLRLHRPVTRR